MDLDLTPQHLHILRHSLGLDDNGHGREYRNHYVSGPGHHSCRLLQELVTAGYMEERRSPGFLAKGDKCFYVTEKGRGVAWVPEPVLSPRKRRWQAFTDVREALPDLSFKTFLTHPEFARYR